MFQDVSGCFAYFAIQSWGWQLALQLVFIPSQAQIFHAGHLRHVGHRRPQDPCGGQGHGAIDIRILLAMDVFGCFLDVKLEGNLRGTDPNVLSFSQTECSVSFSVSC